jgi:hypothetical protein
MRKGRHSLRHLVYRQRYLMLGLRERLPRHHQSVGKVRQLMICLCQLLLGLC